MYNIKHRCSYQNVRSVHNSYSEEELQTLENCQYRNDVLSAFVQKSYNDSDVNKMMKYLFDSYCNKEPISVSASIICPSDLYLGFCLLFSYDYFYMTHACICSLIEEGIVPTDISQPLLNAVKLEERLIV
jgi:hypothetical protein